MSAERLKWIAIVSFVVSLGLLLLGGFLARDRLAPYPGQVVGPGGTILFERKDILAGQDVYQRYGLMDHGSVWGHGSQRGMEFSAVTLHHMGQVVGNDLATKEFGKSLAELDPLQRDIVRIKTAYELKENRYAADTDTLRLTASQVKALETNNQYWETVFRDGQSFYGTAPVGPILLLDGVGDGG
jgi:nitric oxide reductase subunit B